ncbi:MAG: Nif3-like dinuclear metal center hexameric protein [Acidimicrobiia bacterium]|nr:Nif3-like dinuclear metal center hexameric protein [Acidimicrobiia bacterium]MXZ06150.1 Nif3-like dinuclear metal center hexameric protein [Acidimicrobiia bacterium]MYD03719.1 Nif3-like dinuclear metal center hexameric protein [Acidimicrobiia bacterium]MYF26778.1 Nif3-like dinuclear metal center hexameric protein [Acidimicrobiia bacterium]MYH56366.1 Nif3-like dinuclear metal center hexameric protein [Acidimicrobiia bacterium]
MSLTVAEILKLIDQRAPFASAAEWDAVGLQIGDPYRPVSKVAVVHEITERVVKEVIAAEADLVVTYHPLVFEPLRSVIAGPGQKGRAFALLEARIAVVAVHTNWDTAPGGTSDSLAAALDIRSTDPFASATTGSGETQWFGRCGRFGGTVGDLVDLVRQRLGNRVRVSEPQEDRVLGRVAVLPGAGGSYSQEALLAGADAYVTGDVAHHQARLLADNGVVVVDAGHTPTERPGIKALGSFMAEISGEVIDLVGVDDDPWEWEWKG